MFLSCRVWTLYDRMRNLWSSHYIYVVLQFLVNLISIIFLALQGYCCFSPVLHCLWGASRDANGRFFANLYASPRVTCSSYVTSLTMVCLLKSQKNNVEKGQEERQTPKIKLYIYIYIYIYIYMTFLPSYLQTSLWFCRLSYVIGWISKSHVLASLDVAYEMMGGRWT